MSLFQIQVERQFLAGITTDLTSIYKKYVDYFGNPAIQANILGVIEEQYQGEFIRALFVDILGYTAQPHPNFNLIREKKNETDAKSADAAISINNQITAIIELKDHKTQDLKKVEVQAFGYKNNHKNCHYVVTSNFERLRFYIDNAVDFIEFDLFNLTFEDFRRLWLCLSYESIAKNLPQEIKNQSVSNEDVITRKLYKDYSAFKRLLFDNIVLLNPEHDKLLLFKETQKLLDRFLFLFFAEDKSLLPANSVKGTVDKWKRFNADPMNDYQPLYSRFVKYFKLLDEGYKDATTEIYAYNGGLFANDELLNKIKVEDAVLADHVIKLAAYDYGTDVDVNILGHIFENSLNELEQVAQEISTGEKTTSKRKQDGVFYTPRYITQYIVENTVGRLCEEKKTELGIGEELFEYKRADKRKQALKVFDTYREWLLQITIVDPACGSGAFLNTALDFLIAEHKWIDNQQDKIAGSKDHYSMGLSNIENTILENNLFGVDINEESVEIAKLSLWLRTAKPHRKLSSLNNNIKCGNSLIDDPAVAGDKAFNWEKEFPQVFGREQKTSEVITLEKDKTPDYLKLIKEKSAEAQLKAEQGIALSKEALEISKQLAEYAEKLEAVSAPKPKYEKMKGGFDVVIGNPPYVQLSEISSTNDLMKKYLIDRYKSSMGRLNTYAFFIKLALEISKHKGLSSYIIPNTILTQEYYKKIRFDLINDSEIIEIIQFLELPFADAVVENIILSFKNQQPNDNNVEIINSTIGKFTKIKEISQANFLNNIDYNFNIYDKTENNSINEKLKQNTLNLGEISEVNQAIALKGSRDFWVHKESRESNYVKVLEGGKNINRYSLDWGGDFLDYKREGIHSCNRTDIFESSEKIFFRRVANKLIGTLDTTQLYALHTIVVINIKEVFKSKFDLKYILALFNSNLLSFYYKINFISTKTVFTEIGAQKVRELPIPDIDMVAQQPFVEKADRMLNLTKELNDSCQKFQRMLQRNFELEELPGKLQNWYLLSYKEFIAELGKKKVKLTLAQEAEWEDYFNTEKAKALEIKKQIDDTDREIDSMVYVLYELTDEEVKIVEGEK
jgi:type I restriction-modification system DNA methylase subunit